MPRSYRYLHYDVFTARRFGGNQLAVFLDGRGLTGADMQAIAKEMNFSESTFVLPPDDPGTDMRVRIFTPGAELPMAGHPTIGTAFALARAGVLGPADAGVRFGLGVGPIPVDLTWRGDDLAFAWMTQPNPTFGPTQDVADLAGAAVRLPGAAIRATALPVQRVSCGVPYLMIPVASRREVDAAVVDSAAFERLAAATDLDANGLYLFTLESAADDATVYSRMFAPGIGILEDPATGSAAGPLGCYLVAHEVISAAKAATIVNLQGVQMGRPSVIHMAIAADGGSIHRVRVGGEAVLAGEGTLYV
jgi:trans-2,3-dihydro-3-hydroxyanthranilate isomerase